MRNASSGSGAAGMGRWRRSRRLTAPDRSSGRSELASRLEAAARGTALTGLAIALLVGCSGLPSGTAAGGQDPSGTGADQTEESSSGRGESPQAASAELDAACGTFWGDPDYRDPLSRTVLDRAATAPDAGPDDPFFYAMTADDVDAVFEDVPEDAPRTAAAELADWFRSEPERGADADGEAFASAWEGLAGACAGSSVAASWAAGGGEDGTKPAALVCADVFDTPGTLTVFANANVLTSNMFKLVGLSAMQVPSDRMDDVRATSDLLGAEISAVDDDGVRAALEEVRQPFLDALEGDTRSDGLQTPLDHLGSACGAIGYDSPETGSTDSGDETDDGGLV